MQNLAYQINAGTWGGVGSSAEEHWRRRWELIELLWI